MKVWNHSFTQRTTGLSSLLIGLIWWLFSASVQASVEIEHWQTAKGTDVYFVGSEQLPMVDVEVRFDAGSARDGQAFGLAAMTSQLMGTATPKLDERAISEGFNRLGAQFGASVGRDSASLSMRTLTRESLYEQAVDLFEQSLVEAVFRPEILEREKARLEVAIKQKATQPQSLASEAMWTRLYGDHPYAHPTEGTLETLDQLTIDNIRNFYQQYYVARNAQVTIVGDLSRAQAERLAERLTQRLPGGQTPEPIPPVNKVAQTGQAVTQFDATQTQIVLATLGVKRGDPDYYALFLGNHLLGGSGFASLLMEEVREKRGLVYGVSSGFRPMRAAGPFVIRLSTQNAKAHEALDVVEATLKGFMQDFSEEKLDAIKSNLIGGFPLRLDSNAKIAGYISMIGFYDLPLDYLDRFPEKIRALSKAEVLQAWQKRMDFDQATRILVGQPQ
ncbi:MAG: pitrilysin family protein [Hydrogenovibrio sp.]|uniref:M16 family metallopeptidase n=1 Tax=Hydrogenovibrio sp. TaxID=2065821 RepID=UPI00286FB2D1|nr:pitrilysin family protein [Hydrogenovibrio sp.]MDR9499409.1 pitrilysin family protein [Hydrogenovibrio sp.]